MRNTGCFSRDYHWPPARTTSTRLDPTVGETEESAGEAVKQVRSRGLRDSIRLDDSHEEKGTESSSEEESGSEEERGRGQGTIATFQTAVS